MSSRLAARSVLLGLTKCRSGVLGVSCCPHPTRIARQFVTFLPHSQWSASSAITCCAFASSTSMSQSNCPPRVPSENTTLLSVVQYIHRHQHFRPQSSSSHTKKPSADFQLKTIQGKELLKDALEQRKEKLREKRDDFVKDMRATKHRVKERVRNRMDEIVERENVMTIPNLLCVSRAALAPYLYYVVAVQADYSLAMGLLAFAGLTDLLDGYIARNWPGQASKMGSFLDPMADKLLVGALAVSMCTSGMFPVWLCAMVLFRDVFLIGAGFIIRWISLPPPKTMSRYFDVTHATAQLEPTFISKVNTAVQLAAIATSLGAPIWNYVDHAALHGLWYFTGVTTVAAALSYVISKDTYRILKQTGLAKSSPKNP